MTEILKGGVGLKYGDVVMNCTPLKNQGGALPLLNFDLAPLERKRSGATDIN